MHVRKQDGHLKQQVIDGPEWQRLFRCMELKLNHSLNNFGLVVTLWSAYVAAGAEEIGNLCHRHEVRDVGLASGGCAPVHLEISLLLEQDLLQQVLLAHFLCGKVSTWRGRTPRVPAGCA